MLYLNLIRSLGLAQALAYLTLTNVVFELSIHCNGSENPNDLTLTNVVFEFHFYFLGGVVSPHLTLTNVVFEFRRTEEYTLTLHVFNFNKCCI